MILWLALAKKDVGFGTVARCAGWVGAVIWRACAVFCLAGIFFQLPTYTRVCGTIDRRPNGAVVGPAYKDCIDFKAVLYEAWRQHCVAGLPENRIRSVVGVLVLCLPGMFSISAERNE